MSVFRISKYDPRLRICGKYMADEWTDYSDIGRSFDGKILTEEEYLSIENRYLCCIRDIMNCSCIPYMLISGLEIYEKCIWSEGCIVSVEKIDTIIRDCFRNVCWCKLEYDDMYIHFGYDFYIYVSTHSEADVVNEICNRYSLFAEEIFASPYESIH